MDKPDLKELTATNQQTWDERASIHMRDKTGFYAIERFKAGEDILMPIESHEIGIVNKKHLLHLQCHIGIETLCFARRGAFVTGLDFSEISIAAARKLALETKLDAHFVEADLYDAPKVLKGGFDIIFISWGSLNWLPDIWHWGRVIAQLLAPGGYVYLIEQHPFLAMMREKDGNVEPAYAFRTPLERPIVTEAQSSYNEDSSPLVHSRMHEWLHPLSDVITSLLAAGLRLDFLHEHEVLAWQRLPMMVPAKNRLFRLPDQQIPMPLAFSLKAHKPTCLHSENLGNKN